MNLKAFAVALLGSAVLSLPYFPAQAQQRNLSPFSPSPIVRTNLGALSANKMSDAGSFICDLASQPTIQMVLVGDGGSHPIGGVGGCFISLVSAETVFPGLAALAGNTQTGNTHSGTNIDGFVANTLTYAITGQTVSDTGGCVPANDIVQSVNYVTQTVTLVTPPTGDCSNDQITFTFGYNWTTIERDPVAVNGAIRAAINSAGAGIAYRGVWIPPSKLIANIPINETCINDAGNVGGVTGDNCPSAQSGFHGFFPIFWNGSSLNASTISSSDYGKTAIDKMGSRNVGNYKLNLAVSFDTTCSGEALNTGIQQGRALEGNGATGGVEESVLVEGAFNLAAYYNLASEESSAVRSFFWNCDSTGTAHAGVFDGGAHFIPTSDYTNIALTQNVPLTFNAFKADTTEFRMTATSGSPSDPLWVYGSRAIHFVNSYAVAANGGDLVDLFYGTAGGGDSASIAQMPFFELHGEPATYGNTFKVISLNAAGTPTIRDLTFLDYFNEATSAIFALGTNTTGVTLTNPRVVIQKIGRAHV